MIPIFLPCLSPRRMIFRRTYPRCRFDCIRVRRENAIARRSSAMTSWDVAEFSSVRRLLPARDFAIASNA